MKHIGIPIRPGNLDAWSFHGAGEDGAEGWMLPHPKPGYGADRCRLYHCSISWPMVHLQGPRLIPPLTLATSLHQMCQPSLWFMVKIAADEAQASEGSTRGTSEVGSHWQTIPSCSAIGTAQEACLALNPYLSDEARFAKKPESATALSDGALHVCLPRSWEIWAYQSVPKLVISRAHVHWKV